MIQSIKALGALLAQSAHKSYNASLPIRVIVLEQLKSDLYLLQVGARKIQTTSHKPLLMGEWYWAQMGKSSLGHITLSGLVLQPRILEFFNHSFLQFSLQDLENLTQSAKDSDLMRDFNAFFTQKLANSSTKEEFLFFSNMLLGLSRGVLSLSVGDKNDILQLKMQDSNSICFSAIMPILGIIEGKIIWQKHTKILDLKVLFESTKNALERNADELKGFHIANIRIKRDLKPLYEFSHSLLDVRG